MVTKGDRLLGAGKRDGLGVWDGNAVKLECDDHCTKINIVKFSKLKAKKKKKERNKKKHIKDVNSSLIDIQA